MDCYYKLPVEKLAMRLLLFIGLVISLQFMADGASLPDDRCLKKCGDVDILYPFGIGEGCAIEGFVLSCSKTEDGRGDVALYGTTPVLNISLRYGQVRMKSTYISSMCYNLSTKNMDYKNWLLNLTTSPFTISQKENIFIVIGANTAANMFGYSRYSTVS